MSAAVSSTAFPVMSMTGHAGCSVSTVSGLKAGDELMGRTDNHAVAVAMAPVPSPVMVIEGLPG